MAQSAREMAIVPPETEFPVVVRPLPGFVPDDLGTWPDDPGRFEYVDGRLLYMPPCGDEQGFTVSDTHFVIRSWQQQHPDFVVLTGEIGVQWGKDKRGIDVAVWRRAELAQPTGGFVRVPPILAVEVAGQYDKEPYLRDKARWYLQRGVTIVWLVLPETREVIVMTGDRESRHGLGQRLPPSAALPDLQPGVDDLFRQLLG
jgi:Uma2 family endonuclease